MQKEAFIEVVHEPNKPAKLVKMIATKQFKKKNPKTAFGRSTEPVEVKDLADGKKMSIYKFVILS